MRPERRLDRRHAHLRAGVLECPAGAVHVQIELAAGEIRRVEVPEHQARVGDGWLAAAAGVAHGTGIGSGARRAHPHDARSVYPQQTATPGADGVDVHHGHPNRVARDLARAAHRGHAAPDHRHVAARPADVDGHRVPAAGRAREARATDNAPRRPRQKQVDRPARGGTGGGNAAAGLHDVDLAGDTVLAKALLHVGERPLYRRAHVGVEGSHRGPFVLAVDGVHLRGERDEQIGIQRVDDLSRTHLVRVVLE